jgi:hypothetical protein
MKKRTLFIVLVAAAALVLPAAAGADAYLNGALIKRNGVACSSCQLIVQMPFQPTVFIGNAGATITYTNNEAWDVPLQRIVMTETLNVQMWTQSGGNPYACHPGESGNPCPITVWARSACGGGGFQYAPSKTGNAYTAYPNFWGTFTINTSIGCHPA